VRDFDDDRDRHGIGPEKYSQYTVFYCPLDFSWAVRGHAAGPADAARAGRTRIVAEPDSRGETFRVGVAVINGRLSPHSFRGYRRIRPFVAGVLRQVDVLAIQDETYAERFRQLARGRKRST